MRVKEKGEEQGEKRNQALSADCCLRYYVVVLVVSILTHDLDTPCHDANVSSQPRYA